MSRKKYVQHEMPQQEIRNIVREENTFFGISIYKQFNLSFVIDKFTAWAYSFPCLTKSRTERHIVLYPLHDRDL